VLITSYDYGKLDFNQDVTRSDLDMGIYENKFLFVDKIKSLDNPHPKYWKMINDDKTMKSYAFLRMNGESLRLYPYQDLILNDKHRFKYFRSANQTGKSLYLDDDAVISFTEDHGKNFNMAIVSKSLPQSTHQMRRIKGLLNSMDVLDWKEDKGSSDNMSVISLDIKDDKGKIKYTNLIICAPCTEGLLGYDLNKLYLDEFEFWEVDLKYFFNQIAQPRTYHTKGDIIITTNPNGQDNFGAVLEKQIISATGQRKWHVYVFNYLDKPGNTLDEWNQLKAELSRSEFESTVAAIRTTSSKNYLTPEEVERSYDSLLSVERMVGEQPFFFLDVGATHDQSCLTGGFITLDEDFNPDKEKEYNKHHIHVNIPIIHLYPRGYPLSRVVGSYSSEQDGDGWHEEKSVKEHLDEWRNEGVEPIFGCDVTGNSGLIPLFETVNINPVDVTFSGPVKSAMYQRYKYVMEKGLLHRIKHDEWEYQAKHLVAIKSARGYLLINSPGTSSKIKGSDDVVGSKRTPDDTQDSTVGLIHLMDDPDYVPVNVEMF